jgi:hypothetical protein
LRLGGFAACPAELRGAKYFLFTLAKPTAAGRAQSRKGIVIHQKKNPASFKNKILWVKFN